MSSLFRPAGRHNWRFEHRDRTYATGTANKAAAAQIMRDTVTRIEKELAGIPVTAQEKLKGPWEPLLEEYIADLQRLNRCATHIQHERSHITRAMKACRFTSLAAFRLDPFAAFISEIARSGKSARTQNAFRATMYQFLRFACTRGWLDDNPLKHFKPTPARKVHHKRAYTPEEFARLCQTPNGQLYMLAGLSGYRRKECRLMEKQDLSPYADPPTWHARKEVTKARRVDRLPILPEVLPLVRELWDKCQAHDDRLFPDFPRWNAIYKDQKAAGINPYDERGRKAGFHSLRYTFCTILARAMPIHMVQKFMRHTDIRLTQGLYNDLGLTDLWAQAQNIPPLGLAIAPPPRPTLPLSLPQPPEAAENTGKMKHVI